MNLYLFQHITGIGVLGLQILTILLFVYFIYKKFTKKTISFLEKIFSQYGMQLVIISVLFSFLASLTFSDIYHIEACKLCWLQRVALYPQFIIMFIAVRKKDFSAWTYSFWLSFIGFFIAGYQVLEQFRIKALPQAECVIGPDAACSQIHMLEFGYITLPVASLSVFAFILVLYMLKKKRT